LHGRLVTKLQNLIVHDESKEHELENDSAPLIMTACGEGVDEVYGGGIGPDNYREHFVSGVNTRVLNFAYSGSISFSRILFRLQKSILILTEVIAFYIALSNFVFNKPINMRKKFSTLIIVLVVNSLSHAQPSLDQSNIGNNTSKSIVDNLQSCLQTFVAGVSGTLSQVKVDIETQNCPYPLTCSIIDGIPGSPVIVTESINVPINTGRTLYSVNFVSPPSLTAGNTYTIYLSANCISGPGQSIFWYKSVTNAYPNGQAYVMSGSIVQPEDSLNDFYFQTYMSIASIEEHTIDVVSVYPNPAGNIMFISGLGLSHVVSASIHNLTGKQISAIHHLTENLIDISRLGNGIYFLHIQTTDNNYRCRFVVNK
jgi:hypothetical protein